MLIPQYSTEIRAVLAADICTRLLAFGVKVQEIVPFIAWRIFSEFLVLSFVLSLKQLERLYCA